MKRLLLALVIAGAVSAHNFHASLTSGDYRPDTKSLEMIVVLNADDLEKAVRHQSGREIEIDRTPDAEAQARAYLTRNFELRAAGQKPVPLQWVGMEIKTNFVYIYVEAKLAEGLESLEIRNDVFRDLQPDQVNLLTVKKPGGGKTADLTFSPGSRWLGLSQSLH